MSDPRNYASHQVGAPPADSTDATFTGPTAMKPGLVPNGGSGLSENQNVYRGDSSPVDPTDWRSTARSRSGKPLSVNEINDQSIVTIGGRTDTLASFKLLGQIPADHTTAPRIAAQEPQQTQEQKQEAPRPPVPEEARRVWEATESEVAPLLELGGGAPVYAAMEAVASGSERALDGAVRSLAQQSGIEPEEMRETVARVTEQYQNVARLAVGMSPEEWQEFSSFCGDRHPQERANAARELFASGNLQPVRDLVAKFREAGPHAGATDESIYRALVGIGAETKRDPGNGTTLVRPRGHGWMSWKTAVKQGLLVIE